MLAAPAPPQSFSFPLKSSRFIPLSNNNTFFIPPKRKHHSLTLIKSSSSSSSQEPSSSSSPSLEPPNQKRSPLSLFLDIPRNLWKQTLRPLSDFGFGQRSIWEGGVGLFLVSGTLLFALSLVWLRAFQLKSRFRKYLAVFEFSQASGISTGTQVRIRGVTVGNVIRVNPSLKCIEAVVEVGQSVSSKLSLFLRFTC